MKIGTAAALADCMDVRQFWKRRRAASRTSSRRLLRFGQSLTAPFEKINVGGAPAYAIDERKMLFLLESFSLEAIEPLLALKPREIVAIDSVFQKQRRAEIQSRFAMRRDAEVRFTCI